MPLSAGTQIGSFEIVTHDADGDPTCVRQHACDRADGRWCAFVGLGLANGFDHLGALPYRFIQASVDRQITESSGAHTRDFRSFLGGRASRCAHHDDQGERDRSARRNDRRANSVPPNRRSTCRLGRLYAIVWRGRL